MGYATVWKLLRLRLGITFASAFAFFCFFFFFTYLWDLRLLFIHCAWTVAAKFDFSYIFQPISAHHALFMDPQISLFNNFFIKNEFHDIIHTFKNYFAIIFFNFQFQFLIFSYIQMYPNMHVPLFYREEWNYIFLRWIPFFKILRVILIASHWQKVW